MNTIRTLDDVWKHINHHYNIRLEHIDEFSQLEPFLTDKRESFTQASITVSIKVGNHYQVLTRWIDHPPGGASVGNQAQHFFGKEGFLDVRAKPNFGRSQQTDGINNLIDPNAYDELLEKLQTKENSND